MRPHPVCPPVVDGAHLEVDALERAEGRLDPAEVFIAAHGLLGAHALLRNGGADHVNAVQGGFGGHFFLVDAPVEGIVGDFQQDVLSHFVLVDGFADAQPDLVFPLERFLRPLRRCDDLVELLLRRREQLLALSRAFLGEKWITADNESFTWIVR